MAVAVAVTAIAGLGWETLVSKVVDSLCDKAMQYCQDAQDFKDEWKTIREELEIVQGLLKTINEVIEPFTPAEIGEGVQEVLKLESHYITAMQAMDDAFQATQSYSSIFLWPSQLQKIKKAQEDVHSFVALASPLILAVLQKAHHKSLKNRLKDVETNIIDSLHDLEQRILAKESSASSPTGRKVLKWIRSSFRESGRKSAPAVPDTGPLTTASNVMLLRIGVTILNNSDSKLHFFCSKYGGIGSDDWFPLAPGQRDRWIRSEGEHVLIVVKESCEYVYFQACNRHVLVNYSRREGFKLHSSGSGVSPAHRLDSGVLTPSSSGFEICNHSKRTISVFISKYTDTNASDNALTVAPGSTAAQARPLNGCELVVIGDLHRQACAAHYGAPARIEWHGFTVRPVGISIINNSDSEIFFFCSNFGGNGSDTADDWKPLAPGKREEWVRVEGEYLLIVAKKEEKHHSIYFQVHNSPVVVGYSPREGFYILSSSGMITPASLLEPSPPSQPSQWEVSNYSGHIIYVFISKHTNSVTHGLDKFFTIAPGSTEMWDRPSDGHEVMVIRDPHRGVCAAHYGAPSRVEWHGFTMRQTGISIANKSQFRHHFFVSSFGGFGSDDWWALDSGKGDEWIRTEGEYVLIVVKESRQFVYFQVRGIHVYVSYSPAQGFVFHSSPDVTPVRRPNVSRPTHPSQWEVCNSSSRGIYVFVSMYTNPHGSDEPLAIAPGSTQTWDRPFDGNEVVVIRDPLIQPCAAHYGAPARIEWRGF